MKLTESYLDRVIKEVIDNARYNTPDFKKNVEKFSNSFHSKANDQIKKVAQRNEKILRDLKKKGYLDYYDIRIGYPGKDGKLVIKTSGTLASNIVDGFKEYMAKYHPEEKVRFVLMPRNDNNEIDNLKHFDIKIMYQK